MPPATQSPWPQSCEFSKPLVVREQAEKNEKLVIFYGMIEYN